MIIKILTLSTTVERTPHMGRGYDPDWRHTSKKGTVYRYDKAKRAFDPAPEVRTVHMDCPDPGACGGGCDGWDEDHYYDDAGDRFVPGTRMETFYTSGVPHTEGTAELSDCTVAEAQELVYPSVAHPAEQPPPVIQFDDPRIRYPARMSGILEGYLWFHRMVVDDDPFGQGVGRIIRCEFGACIENVRAVGAS